MPIYKVKPEKNDGPATVSEGPSNKERYPSVTVQVSPEIIDALEVDQDAEVTLRGKIVGLSSNKGDMWGGSNGDRCELRIELREVEAHPDPDAANEEAGADDDPEETMGGAIDKALGYAKKDDATE